MLGDRTSGRVAQVNVPCAEYMAPISSVPTPEAARPTRLRLEVVMALSSGGPVSPTMLSMRGVRAWTLAYLLRSRWRIAFLARGVRKPTIPDQPTDMDDGNFVLHVTNASNLDSVDIQTPNS